MIDWPNLLLGAVLGAVIGFLPGLGLWLGDRAKAKRQRREETMSAWAGVAKELELASMTEGTTSGDLYKIRVKHPVDLWRTILGPEDFRRLERLENGFQSVEIFARRLTEGTDTDPTRYHQALQSRRDAIIEFANQSRLMQSVSYDAVVTREQRDRVKADYRSHPFKTWRRERHNRRARRAAGIT